jgi:hypothetical protein
MNIGVVIAIFTLVVVIAMYRTRDSTSKNEKKAIKMGKSAVKKRLVYINGDSISLYDAWRGNIPYNSVFSPGQPDWYFDISGLDEKGNVMFSTSWHNHLVLSQVVPKYEDIKRWQVVVVDHLGSRPTSNTYKNLRWE